MIWGSIQAVGDATGRQDAGRSTRGISCTGLGNTRAGFMGVIGPVNFLSAPGSLLLGCAARPPVAAGIIMLQLAFSAPVTSTTFPSSLKQLSVVSCYSPCAPGGRGLSSLYSALEEPILTYASFAGLAFTYRRYSSFPCPAEVVSSFPSQLRPIRVMVCNGGIDISSAGTCYLPYQQGLIWI